MKKMNVIKQASLYAILPLMLAACGNDEPRPEPTPNKPIEQVEPNKQGQNDKGEDKKEDNKQNNDAPKPGDQPAGGEDKKPEGGENKPAPQAELSQEELDAYLGGLNRYWGIAKVREQIKQIGVLKDIKGKAIKVTDIQLTNEVPAEGKFTLRVRAEVAGQSLERSFDYTGFAKTPDAYRLAKNMGAEWRVAKEVYARDFALDKLFEDKDTKPFTAEYLSRFVNFYSSDFSIPRYVLSSEEAKDIKILDISYRDGSVSFKTEVKGVKSDRAISLPLSLLDYYNAKVSTTNADASKYYAAGVANNPSVYLTNYVDIDSERYYYQGVSAQAVDASEAVQFTFTLYARKGEMPLATITKTIKGFRSLTNLAKDMTISGNHEVNQRLGKLVGTLKGGDVLVSKLNGSIQNWIKSASIYVKDFQLSWDETPYQPGVGSRDYLGGGHGVEDIHYYFVGPRFQVTEARVEDNRLYVKFKVLTVNDQSFHNLKLERESNFHLIK